MLSCFNLVECLKKKLGLQILHLLVIIDGQWFMS